MENASKAIIMAGGVLIAVAVISLALYVYFNFGEYAKTSDQMLTISQIESFNRFYESYDSDPVAGSSYKYSIRGIDAINIWRKAKEDREKDESFIVDGETVINAISGDSSSFLDDRYTVQYQYDGNGKITKVDIDKTF